MLEQMRSAQFDIEVGPQYFAFMREVLVFLIQVVDRMAYDCMPEGTRAEFTTALVQHLAEILQDSENDLLGSARRPGEPSHGAASSTWSTRCPAHYAEFGADPAPTDGAPASSPTSPSCATWAAA